MTVLSYSYGIITNRAINAPGHGDNVFDGIKTTDKRHLKGGMDLIGKLGSNDTTNIGMLTSDSKYVSIKFADQCLHFSTIKKD